MRHDEVELVLQRREHPAHPVDPVACLLLGLDAAVPVTGPVRGGTRWWTAWVLEFGHLPREVAQHKYGSKRDTGRIVAVVNGCVHPAH